MRILYVENDRLSNGVGLGIYTNNSAMPLNSRFERFKERFKLLNSARKLLKGERVSSCFYNRVESSLPVDVFLNKIRNRANYGNVMRCANPWGCPVCASIISENRKLEVKKAMDWWLSKDSKHCVYLLTLTVPHYSNTDIRVLRDGLKKAYSKMFKGIRASKDLFCKYKIEHYISVFEVTHGENGFHPHYHVLLFLSDSFELSLMRSEWYSIWVDCCVKSGLGSPSFEHGLSIQDGRKASAYVSKWGLEHEMTKGHIKKGKLNSRTPFDILRSYHATGNEEDGKLFVLYYFAFKGYRQLNWSRGFKKISQVVEKTDIDIVNETDGLAELIFSLDIEIWNKIRKAGKQGDLLVKIQEDHSLKQALDFITDICISKYQTFT